VGRTGNGDNLIVILHSQETLHASRTPASYRKTEITSMIIVFKCSDDTDRILMVSNFVLDSVHFKNYSSCRVPKDRMLWIFNNTCTTSFDPQQRQRIFLLAPASRPALGPTQPPIQWVPGVLSPGVKGGRGVTLTTHPHLVPRLSMSSPQAPPWRVAGQLYFLYYQYGPRVTSTNFSVYN
jgi:hypothetical protein